MISIVDTHAHVDLPAFDDDRGVVIDRALDAGVGAIVAIGFSPERWTSTAALADAYPMVVRTVGLHPNHATDWSVDLPAMIEHEAEDPRVVAIGEIGLDFYRNHADPDRQRVAFVEQIALAKRLDLPVVIHQRDAEDEVIELLGREGPVRGVMHCFSGDQAFAARCIDLGFYLGVGGVVTYKASGAVRDAVASAPLDRLILETDAPYLAPQGHRGQRNEPALIVHAAGTLAKARGMDVATLAEATTRNAVALFGDALAAAVRNGEARRACE
ncbi:MAG TPA: TatD family hydrolase [Thermomicrobiales bacterium]|nr:TatD family hydrolase [Thermomicrobiales bacterium]